jgi:REP element-mobilizing transposase RayT
MMPKPRYAQVSLEATPYYHCMSRCVRRAYLCGTDISTGESFEHRRQWIEDKLFALSDIFAIDICAYAIMSNHYHLVLHINRQQAQNWSDDQVINTWHRLFSGNLFSQRYCSGEALNPSELNALKETITLWRTRLIDISWFMRVLNESIARQANAEETCTGRFWEGRFKSQALLDEAAILACMAYVDLNPIRADIAQTPETCDYTSIKQRIHQTLHPESQRESQPENHTENQYKNKKLYAFTGHYNKNNPDGLPFTFNDYIELIEESGRTLRNDKRGHIHQNTPPILQRLNMNSKNWMYLTQHFESKLKGMVGSVYKLRQACEKLGYKRMPGFKSCAQFFT